MIVVPQKDFVGFVAKNSRTSIMMATGVVALAAIMAGLLVFQGLRSDRNARLLLDRQRELESQSRAFAALASKASLFNPTDHNSLEEVTEVIAATLGARRVGIWRFSKDGKNLACDDCYDRESGGHLQGTVLKYENFPQFFEQLQNGENIVVTDAGADDCTAELYRVYLRPLGSDSLLAVPIIHQKRAAGAVWLEHEGTSRSWSSEEITFTGAIANMVAMRFAAQSGFNLPGSVLPVASGEDQPALLQHSSTEPGSPAGPVVEKTINGELNRYRLSADPSRVGEGMPASAGEWLDTRVGKHRQIGAQVYTDTVVCVLRWTDPIALAEKIRHGKDSLVIDHLACHVEEIAAQIGIVVIDHLACHVEEIAAQIGIEYVSIMNEQIICAAGVTRKCQDRASRMAEFALSVQQACLHVFAELDRRMDFRIGLDCGAVFGGLVGRKNRSHVLWGEAADIARLLAESGVNGGIHVSESFYRRLPAQYLYKVRGSYYLPAIGEINTYLLTGRL
jgi:hypothetical protein